MNACFEEKISCYVCPLPNALLFPSFKDRLPTILWMQFAQWEQSCSLDFTTQSASCVLREWRSFYSSSREGPLALANQPGEKERLGSPWHSTSETRLAIAFTCQRACSVGDSCGRLAAAPQDDLLSNKQGPGATALLVLHGLCLAARLSSSYVVWNLSFVKRASLSACWDLRTTTMVWQHGARSHILNTVRSDIPLPPSLLVL